MILVLICLKGASGAPGWLGRRSMRLLDLGVMNSSPTWGAEIIQINTKLKIFFFLFWLMAHHSLPQM